MKALFSTAYFPPVAYLAALSRHDGDRLFELYETFPKQTYRNRAVIMTAGGLRNLTVPVVRTNHSRTGEVKIDDKTPWRTIHLRTIEAAYAASPYYMFYRDEMVALLTNGYEYLYELDREATRWVLRKLSLSDSYETTTDWIASTGGTDDYRNRFSPKVPYPTETMPPYYQVFSDRLPFAPNLSILDPLFNLGPEAGEYLKKVT